MFETPLDSRETSNKSIHSVASPPVDTKIVRPPCVRDANSGLFTSKLAPSAVWTVNGHKRLSTEKLVKLFDGHCGSLSRAIDHIIVGRHRFWCNIFNLIDRHAVERLIVDPAQDEQSIAG